MKMKLLLSAALAFLFTGALGINSNVCLNGNNTVHNFIQVKSNFLNDTAQESHIINLNKQAGKLAIITCVSKSEQMYGLFYPSLAGVDLTDVTSNNHELTVDKNSLNPVSLNINHVNWQTIFEGDNNGFTIKRSSNVIEFEKKVFERPYFANGNSNDLPYYSFVDDCSLKNIDGLGKPELLPISGAEAACSSDKLITNPLVKKDLSMVLSSNKRDIATLLLIDYLGNVVYERIESIVRGKNNIYINTENLPNGWYLLKVRNGLGELVLSRKILEI